MKIQFYLRFHTEVGQSLWVTSNGHMPDEKSDTSVPMIYLNNEWWQGKAEINFKSKEQYTYKYFLKNKDGETVWEWGNDRIIKASKAGITETIVIDTWNHA